VIGETENEGVEVGHIARHLKCMNLPTAVRQQFVAAGKAAQDERAVIGRVSLACTATTDAMPASGK
jgi:hypothetical protein